MIRSDIGEGGEVASEFIDSSIRLIRKYINPDARVRTRKLKFESPQANKRRLTGTYREKSLAINLMTTGEMFQLIAKLKRDDLILDEILKSILTLRYVPVSDDSNSGVGEDGERKRPRYSLSDDSR
jgi:hypothetical protein